MSADLPLLSFCLFGRNDNYTPDFIYRLSTAINFIAVSVELANIDIHKVEIVLVDWNSAVPLRQVLPLTDTARKIVRFVEVSLPETDKNSPLPINKICNLALRRAKGQFISIGSADLLIPEPSWLALFRVLDGHTSIPDIHNAFFVCGRVTIPVSVVNSQPSILEWQRFLRLNSWTLQPQAITGGFLSGIGGFFMAHRALFWKSTGLMEKLDPCWGWNDIELTLRMMAHVEWYDLRASGFLVYDMEHEKCKGERPQVRKNVPPKFITSELSVNDETWGEVPFKVQEMRQTIPVTSQDFPVVRKQVQIQEYAVSDDVGQLIYQFCEFANARPHWRAISELDVKLGILAALLSEYTNVQRFLEVGTRKNRLVYFVAGINPCCELVCIDQWAEIDDVTGPQNIAYICSKKPINHQGYVRMMNKGTQACLETLTHSTEHNFPFSLISLSLSKQSDLRKTVDLLEPFVGNATEIIIRDDRRELSIALISQLLANKFKRAYIADLDGLWHLSNYIDLTHYQWTGIEEYSCVKIAAAHSKNQ